MNYGRLSITPNRTFSLSFRAGLGKLAELYWSKYGTTNRIRHEASQNHRSAGQIANHLNLPIKKRRVQQILSTTKYFAFKKACKKPALKQFHKDAQFMFAGNNMHMKLECGIFI
jgi:hypothetical protein